MPQNLNTSITQTGNEKNLYFPITGGQLDGGIVASGQISSPRIIATTRMSSIEGVFDNLQAGNSTSNTVVSVNTITDNLIVKTGSIQLNDEAGVQILQAVGTELFFNGQLISTDGENVSDWATFPAVQDVDLNNKNIINVTKINNVSYPPPTNIFVSLDLYATISPLFQKDYGISPLNVGQYFVTAGSNLGVPGLYTVNFTSTTFPRNSSFFIKNVTS